MFILIFYSVTDLRVLEDVKKGESDANFLGIIPKICFQQVIIITP